MKRWKNWQSIGWNSWTLWFYRIIFKEKEKYLVRRSFICSVCNCFCRCWVSGGTCISQGLGHSLLDQFNHILHHKTHCWSKTSRSFQPGSSDYNVWRWSSARISSRRMSKVCIISFLPGFNFCLMSRTQQCFSAS